METAAATTADPAAAETTLRPTPKNKPMGFLSYANGALKRHYPTAPAAASPPPVSYKECMRNHAASMGGHALDGCCEFMPSPVTFNPDDPSSLRCAACGCHRNFHRRDPDDPAPLHRHRPLAPVAHILMSTSLKTPSPAAKGKKRHRTKFSEAQKEKMRGFSERFGWKMQKIERRVVDEFCHEIGVGRQVLKVWMHNHKNGTTSNGNGDLGRRLVHGGIGAHNGDVDVGGAGNGGGGGQSDHDDVVVSSGEGSSSPSSSSGFSI